jgi:hypothetical protein
VIVEVYALHLFAADRLEVLLSSLLEPIMIERHSLA